MKLFLLRHADAEVSWPDSERRLTSNGKHTLDQLCSKVSAQAFNKLTHLWHSPYVRAVETAQHVKQGLNLQPELEATSGLTPEDNPVNLTDQLNQQKGDLLIVGHNPHLSLFAAYLIFGDPWSQILQMKKAGLLCLERESPPDEKRPAGVWELSWYITPKSIA